MSPPDEAALDHLGLFVTDLERSRAFYEEVLGMRLVDRDEDEGFFMLTLRGGAREVHLFQPKAPDVPARIDHIALRVGPDAFEWHMADLRRRGIPFSGPHRYRGTRFVKLADPDGLVWEYITEDQGPSSRSGPPSGNTEPRAS